MAFKMVFEWLLSNDQLVILNFACIFKPPRIKNRPPETDDLRTPHTNKLTNDWNDSEKKKHESKKALCALTQWPRAFRAPLGSE